MIEVEQQARELQISVQTFVRTFGLLVTKQTPCGQPVSPSYAHALMLLLDRDSAGLVTTQSELADELGLDKSSITRLCARLEADARVTQLRGAEDGRSRELELTARGRKQAIAIRAASQARFRRVLEAIPPTSRPAVLDSLQLLTQAVATLKQE
ncbi:MAG TPA: MarR family transcriptional regulator [Polyangiaceae bacterium]|nr:MarR family transcriptional regulator [Polyangiaceae bacterium]